jgi:glycosyltransferase involved in cell wall biosynthesis
MKLLFISPRPIGLIATPGTYLSIEAYTRLYECAIIAKPKTRDNEIIVHSPRVDYELIEFDPADKEYINLIKVFAHSYSPDILCIGSSPKWDHIATMMRESFPGLVIVLEVKSPSLIDNPLKMHERQLAWQHASNSLSGVIAPSVDMIKSYISNITCPFFIHRSIIDYKGIEKKTYTSNLSHFRKFIFTGSLGPTRKIDKLLHCIAAIPISHLKNISIDIYGDGPVLEDLILLSKELNLVGVVNFKGAIRQKDLFKLYKNYDAGIAWVPSELFDGAPSLKLIEYCAAGLVPVATSTAGHKLLADYGFKVWYFNPSDINSFAELLVEMINVGAASEPLINNIERASEFDYIEVISNQIFNFYSALLKMNNTLNKEAKNHNQPNDNSDRIKSDSGLFKQWRVDSMVVNSASVKLVGANKWYASERLRHAQRKVGDF